MIEEYSRVYAEVDLDALQYNIENMKKNIRPGTKMVGVIKTDGYGHGAIAIAKELEKDHDFWGMATATFEEADILRKSGIEKPLLILGYTFPYCYEKLAEKEIRPAVFREDTLEQLNQIGLSLDRPVKIHIKVDTGMSRIGITPDQNGLEFVAKALACKGILVEGIFTHFAKADEADKHAVNKQIRLFKEFVAEIETKLSYRVPLIHCSNSAGIVDLPEANCDMVRAGITLYGLWPSDEVHKEAVPLKPLLSLKSKIVYIKEIKKGTAVSYGGTFVAPEDMFVATIPVGYGDGYPRSLSSKGYVLIKGKKAPIIGRVCMDQMMVDVTGIENVSCDDVVTLIGTDQNETITMEALGDLSGRFNYELACDLGKRIPRVYTKNGTVVFTKDYYDDILK